MGVRITVVLQLKRWKYGGNMQECALCNEEIEVIEHIEGMLCVACQVHALMFAPLTEETA